MGRGLSEQQKAVLRYLEKRQEAGEEVVPSWLLLADVYRLKCNSRTIFLSHMRRFTTAENARYATARASMFRTVRRLRSRGLVQGPELGVIGYRELSDRDVNAVYPWMTPEYVEERKRTRREAKHTSGYKLTDEGRTIARSLEHATTKQPVA